jgi:predicted metal-dependent enzyme (double-stranded beta helix superfamily)
MSSLNNSDSAVQRLIKVSSVAVQNLAAPFDMESVGEVVAQLDSAVMALDVSKGLPYGRYLLHNDAGGRFNIQVDVFSMDYTGAIHSHDTWGVCWILHGGLHTYDYDGTSATLVPENYCAYGTRQSFCPVAGDWHKIRTLARGPQPVSVHIYGQEFNLDEGTYLDGEFEPQRGRRSAFGDDALLRDALACGNQ